MIPSSCLKSLGGAVHKLGNLGGGGAEEAKAINLALDTLHWSNYGTPKRDCPQVSR